MPGSNRFGPLDNSMNQGQVIMSVEEYETIRLIDLEGYTQEECSVQMNIARTTVQGIYFNARKKLADSLVNGKMLKIKGGTYKLCDGLEESCRCGGCLRHRHRRDFGDREQQDDSKRSKKTVLSEEFKFKD